MVHELENDIVVGTVLKTNDYSKFKLLVGNRPVLERRKQRIKKSVLDNGQLFSPIIVNEKMEIIDGQGRFEVFKSMNLPVTYIIQPGLSLHDCVVFNSSSTQWTSQDYIDSYVAQGNENYIRLNSLVKTHKTIPIGSIAFAALGVSGFSRQGDKNDIRSGKITISESQFIYAENCLGYAERFLGNYEDGSGNRAHFLSAVIFCFGVDGIDREKLVDKWNKYGNIKSVKIPAISIRDAIKWLERAYNFKTPSDSVVYLESAYDKYCREQTASYFSRWQSKRKE